MARRRILWISLALLIMVVSGTIAYSLIEHWTLLDSLYMTIIVITTIGFQEVHPLSAAGRLFTIIFSLISFCFLAGSISIISSSIIEGDIFGNRRRKKMLRNIQRMRDHIIVCGAGRVGSHVIQSLIQNRKAFVVVDSDEQIASKIMKENPNLREVLFVHGDATKEEILIQTGVKNAFGLISCVRDDAVNLFISLTAKKLNSQLKISSYVMDEVNMSKFYLVGADEVISGDFVIGKRLTMSMLNKNVASFLEQTNFMGENEAFFVGDVEISSRSAMVNKTLRETDIYRKVGLLIFALKKQGASRYTYNPDSDTLLEAGDVLVTFGSEKDLVSLEKYVNGR